MLNIRSFLNRIARPSAALITGLSVATSLPVQPTEAAMTGDVAIGHGVFDKPGEQIAARADELLNNELLKHYDKDSIVPGITVKKKPSGHVRYLDSKPTTTKIGGQKVGAVASYFEVHARIKFDVDVTFGTRKIAAVNTEQIVEVLTIPRVKDGIPIVEVKASVISATARKERQAKQRHADEFRDRVRDAINAELQKRANRSFNLGSLAGGRLTKAGVINRIEVYDAGVRAKLGNAGNGYAKDTSSKKAKSPGKVTVYEHNDYGGKACTLDLRFYKKNVVHEIPHGFPNDAMSSIKGRLNGVTIIFYEHANGGGRKYTITGNGDVADRSVGDDHFNDKWTSWKWVN